MAALASNVGGVVAVVAGKMPGVYEDEREEAKSAVDFGLGWEEGRMGRDGRGCFSLRGRCLGLSFEI